MKKFYNLKNDYLFKQIFKEEKYLKHLFKELFNVECQKIKYLNTELIKDNFKQKAGIVDLLLEVDGKIVILELQNIDRKNFKERLVYYSSNIISKYCLKKGEDYIDIKPIKVYAIINYSSINDNVIDIVNLKQNQKVFTENLEYKIFDLTKVNGSFNEFISLFKENNIDNLNKIIKNETNKEILEKMRKYNLDEKEYQKMEDIVEMLKNETEHYETAERVGRREGEIKKQNEIAKKMFKKGMKISDIIELTGLSKSEVNKLKLGQL